MAFNPKRLRRWIAALGVLLLAVVVGFYSYARYKVRKEIAEIPKRLGVDIQRSTEGFTYTQSSGGRALFTISAGKAVQYKEGQKASLQNVRIVVFGGGDGEAERYDQILGKEFAYDPQSGDVTALSEVHIDLQASGKPATDPSQVADSGRVHIRTSGLTFNQKTGIGQTRDKIEFSLPQAQGSAAGALYDSKKRSLVLNSEVHIRANESAKTPGGGKGPTNIHASHALITDQPLTAVLSQVRLEQEKRTLRADTVTIGLREDDSIEKIVAQGNVSGEMQGKTATSIKAGRAEFDFSGGKSIRQALLTGAVEMQAKGASPMSGSAGKVVIDLNGKNEITKVRAGENVKFAQLADSAKSKDAFELQASAVDFSFNAGSQLQSAVTSGASQIVMDQASGRSLITASKFEAAFAARNRLRSLKGSPDAKMITSNAGAPDRTISGQEVIAQFDFKSATRTSIGSVDVVGRMRYQEGRRTASAERARFVLADDVLQLNGSPRVQDEESGLTITATTLRMNRKTGEVMGDGDVKTTFRQQGSVGSGAMFSGSDPIHATGASVVADRNSGIARFTGGARLWQGANMVQAPVIVFQKNRRALTATGTSQTSVQTVFVQTDKAGKQVPIQIHAAKLTYVDQDRKGTFEGGVRVKIPDTTLTASRVDVLLRQKKDGQSSAGAASQVDQIVATGGNSVNLVIEQENPVRRAIGERLVYTASDSKFVLSGVAGNPPSIFDAERGNVTGDSLTFYSRDDRVQVGSGENSRTVTRTRIKDESRP
ncbi:MAG TPA: LptA/OstA family protein, partial [Terriglobales bacterium]|nr:LptA/OstA family protein [Terriglobales bacterium]